MRTVSEDMGLAFQHTAARRRLVASFGKRRFAYLFQHTAARRRLVVLIAIMNYFAVVSTHSRPKAAGSFPFLFAYSTTVVSTHSRPKAAGPYVVLLPHFLWGFNTQPPEGGWDASITTNCSFSCFNTQPPEGGWFYLKPNFL